MSDSTAPSASPPILFGQLAQLVYPSATSPSTGARQLDRAERDRLALFEPLSAPLLRPLLRPDDLYPWHVLPASRWLPAIPQGYSASLGGGPTRDALWQAFSARHPALARRFDAVHAPTHDGAPWWELDLNAQSPAPPRLLMSPGPAPLVAWDEGNALIHGPLVAVPQADPYWLALLGSRVGRRLIAERGPAEVPVPDVAEPLRASLAGLARSLAGLSADRSSLGLGVVQRLVADFGAPGVHPGPRLQQWWSSTFDELRAALQAELHNDIPERFRPTWAQIHHEQRHTFDKLTTRIVALEQAIDAQVGHLF